MPCSRRAALRELFFQEAIKLEPTIATVMRTVRNYFPAACMDGEWTVSGGMLTPLPDSTPDGLIAVTGAVHINGVYRLTGGQFPAPADETWHGRIWLLTPPADFLSLCEEISAYTAAHPATPVISEKFAEHSHTVATTGRGAPVSWQAVFADRLAPFRKMFTEVAL